MKHQLKIVCSLLALALAGQVSASTSWTLTGATPTGGVTSINAYANTGGADALAADVANNAAVQTIQSATWVGQDPTKYYGGVTNADKCGAAAFCDVTEGGYPEHAIDNEQRLEMVLVSFNSLVQLNALTLSWYTKDSDFTVMAYTGTGNPNSNGSTVGKTFSGATALTGWTVIGSYDGAKSTSDVTTPSNRAITYNAANKDTYSSYWLIGAYNPLVGGPVYGSVDTGSTSAYDYIKLSKVTGCVKGSLDADCKSSSNVPEPGSLALVGLGFLGLMRMRKARKV